MESVNISDFRANLLNYLKKARDGQKILVTSHGEVLATIVPPEERNRLARKKLKQIAKTAVVNDITSPIDEQWEVMN